MKFFVLFTFPCLMKTHSGFSSFPLDADEAVFYVELLKILLSDDAEGKEEESVMEVFIS